MSRQKRRVDLTDEDERVMRKVVDRIHAERRDDLEPTAGQENWRHRLIDHRPRPAEAAPLTESRGEFAPVHLPDAATGQLVDDMNLSRRGSRWER